MKSRGSSMPSFGGKWTLQKLEILKKYLKAYTTALKAQPFQLGYIDAFAGTGYRKVKDEAEQSLLLPDLAEDEPQKFLEGSPPIALQIEPPFHKFIFIAKTREHLEALEKLKVAFPHHAQKIIVKREDANKFIQELPRKDWSSRRAVMLLDPFGMQVEWKSIQAIAKTRAIDLWILVPLGLGPGRLLPKDGKVPKPWADRLDKFLGTPEWREAFYATKKVRNVLGEEDGETVKVALKAMGEFIHKRLAGEFTGVAKNPRTLYNTKNSPLYLFCFAASGTEKAAKLAVGIAENILGKI